MTNKTIKSITLLATLAGIACLVVTGTAFASPAPTRLTDAQLANVNGGGPFSVCSSTTPSCPNAAQCKNVGTVSEIMYNNGYHACGFGWSSCSMLNSHECTKRLYDMPNCQEPNGYDYSPADSCD